MLLVVVVLNSVAVFVGGGGGSEFCPALLETAVLRIPTRYSRDFALFSVCSSKNYSSVRCASAANVCGDVDVFNGSFFILKY
jgi:hypothetical protein